MFVVAGFYIDAAPTVLRAGSEARAGAFKSGRGDGAGGGGDVLGDGGEPGNGNSHLLYRGGRQTGVTRQYQD